MGLIAKRIEKTITDLGEGEDWSNLSSRDSSPKTNNTWGIELTNFGEALTMKLGFQAWKLTYPSYDASHEHTIVVG